MMALLVSVSVQAQPELRFFNWSDYMDQKLITQFKNKTNIQVKEVFYESDDERDDILLHTERANIDIIVVNGAMVDSYGKRGWLEPINDELVPNRKNLYSHWQDAFSSTKDYGIPYFW